MTKLQPDPDQAALRARYYRWWKVFGWWNHSARGVKLGPVTVAWYLMDDRWELAIVALCGRPWLDTGLARMRQQS